MDHLSEQIQIIIISSVFLVVVAVGIILLVFIYQRRQLLYVKEKEQLRLAFEQQILESKLEIQEQTFKNISQEVHDNIGQVLSLAKLTVDTDIPEEPQALLERMATSKKLIGKAIDDLRNLSRNLNTDYITGLGLNVSIENEIKLLRKAGSYTAEILVNGEPYRLSHQHELIIYRIFQEVLQNILKHSQGTAVTVTFTFKRDLFSLQIQDNGVGFDSNALEKNRDLKAGIGLRNMRHRAHIIGAKFIIASEVGKGTSVEITLPVNSDRHE